MGSLSKVWKIAIYKLPELTHNIIQICNNVLWEWQYSIEYPWIFPTWSLHVENTWEYSMDYYHSHKTLIQILITLCMYSLTKTFGRKLIIVHTTPSMCQWLLGETWRKCGGWNEVHLISVQLGSPCFDTTSISFIE